MLTINNAGDTVTDASQITVPEADFLYTDLATIDGDPPTKKPEVEPEKLPEENPGLVPETKPNRDNDEGADDDDDDDDDEENDPFTETEIGDDPDDIKTKTTIM